MPIAALLTLVGQKALKLLSFYVAMTLLFSFMPYLLGWAFGSAELSSSAWTISILHPLAGLSSSLPPVIAFVISYCYIDLALTSFVTGLFYGIYFQITKAAVAA